jgi:hypothetical protein
MGVDERTRVEVPAHVPNDFEVFVNGVRQVRGADYELVGRTLLFPRPIAQEGSLGFWRWTLMWLGVIGSYRKHETVDLVYETAAGRDAATLKPQ